MHEKGTEIDFTFRGVSADPFITGDSEFEFMSLEDPPEKLLNGGILPAISGMLPINEQNPTPRLF